MILLSQTYLILIVLDNKQLFIIVHWLKHASIKQYFRSSKLFDEIRKFISIIGHFPDSSILSDFVEFEFKWPKMLSSMGFWCRHCRNTTTHDWEQDRYRWDSYLCSNTYFQKETYHQKNLSWLSMFVSCVHHFRDLIEVCRSMQILSKEICFSMYEPMHKS